MKKRHPYRENKLPDHSNITSYPVIYYKQPIEADTTEKRTTEKKSCYFSLFIIFGIFITSVQLGLCVQAASLIYLSYLPNICAT